MDNKLNLLQIPARTKEGARMRECFVPEKGFKIVGGDLSGAELRILTEASKDPVWTDIFNAGKDLHSELCAKTFNIPVDRVKETSPYGGESYRGVQKTLSFGISYGMGPHKLADKLEIELNDAEKIISSFMNSVPILSKFLSYISHYSVSAKKSITLPPYRRIRWLPWKDSYEMSSVKRQGCNHVPQGTNADWIKLILGRVYGYVISRNLQYEVRPILTVHDEIQTECIESKAAWWRDKLEEIMVSSGQVIIKSIPVVADCKISDAWEK